MNNVNSRARKSYANPGRSRLVAAIAAFISLGLAACGLQKGTNLGCSNGWVHRERTIDRACVRADIRVRFDIHAAGVAAGTAILPLDFTNVGATSCRLGGFPVVTLVTSHYGRQIGAAAVADKRLVAKALDLPAGRTAHIWLRLLDVMSLPVAACWPVSAAGIRVALPGQRADTFISLALITCAKPVHGTDVMIVEPFQLGQALPGTTQ